MSKIGVPSDGSLGYGSVTSWQQSERVVHQQEVGKPSSPVPVDVLLDRAASGVGVAPNGSVQVPIATPMISHGMLDPMQQMDIASYKSMNALGIGHLAEHQQLSMLRYMGQQLATQAISTSPQILTQQILGAQPTLWAKAFGHYALSHGIQQAHTESMGIHLLRTLAQQSPAHWAREALGMLGTQYFHQFDPQSLAAMPDRSLSFFGQMLLTEFHTHSPQQLGQMVITERPSWLLQSLGQHIIPSLPADHLTTMGQNIHAILSADPTRMGQSFLETLPLESLGQQTFGSMPHVQKLSGAELGQQLLHTLQQRGDLSQALSLGIDHAVSKQLLDDQQRLTHIGQQLLANMGKAPLRKATDFLMQQIGQGKQLGELGKHFLQKFGGKVLDKLGGAGKILQGALGLLNGKFDTAKMIKMGLNFIPGVGPILGVLSSIPGVGKVVDKIIGFVGKVLNKIPVIGHIFRGVGKVLGFLGKGVGKLFKGIKKVGTAIFGGIKKVGKKILGGVKKFFSKI